MGGGEVAEWGVRCHTRRIMTMGEHGQRQRPPVPAGPVGPGEGPGGPVRPPVEKPQVEDLLKRMRKVDPDQARRYRQRTGQ